MEFFFFMELGSICKLALPAAAVQLSAHALDRAMACKQKIFFVARESAAAAVHVHAHSEFGGKARDTDPA